MFPELPNKRAEENFRPRVFKSLMGELSVDVFVSGGERSGLGSYPEGKRHNNKMHLPQAAT